MSNRPIFVTEAMESFLRSSSGCVLSDSDGKDDFRPDYGPEHPFRFADEDVAL
jgi:hypothetical protein